MYKALLLALTDTQILPKHAITGVLKDAAPMQIPQALDQTAT
jgi:hypothetical protein